MFDFIPALRSFFDEVDIYALNDLYFRLVPHPRYDLLLNMLSKDLFEPKRHGPVGPIVQIWLVTALFIALVAKCFLEARSVGNVGPASTFAVSLLFVPIYEEILFRGILLGYFENLTSKIKSIALVSALFGVWHLKNVFWYEPEFIFKQVLYTMFVFSPIACFITLRFRSIWPTVILHFLNNLIF